MTKKTRQQVYDKFNGLCAYSGKPLDDKWQVDHAISKYQFGHTLYGKCLTREEYNTRLKEVDNINNLLPAIRRVNHYKRSMNVEQFRKYISTLHLRLAKLPKKTSLESTRKRIEYLNDIADLFGVTIDKPFSGVFYFETLANNDNNG